MILGMSVAGFTELHVILSLIGIATGIGVLLAMLVNRRVPALTALFLATTILTSVTGFFFPTDKILPSQVVGAISLVVLGIAVVALYAGQLRGAWRWAYVGSAVFSLYLNAFVGVVQTFLKVPFFHALAPTQAEPPFAVAQGIVLLAFIALGVLAVRRFRPLAPTLRFAR